MFVVVIMCLILFIMLMYEMGEMEFFFNVNYSLAEKIDIK